MPLVLSKFIFTRILFRKIQSRLALLRNMIFNYLLALMICNIRSLKRHHTYKWVECLNCLMWLCKTHFMLVLLNFMIILQQCIMVGQHSMLILNHLMLTLLYFTLVFIHYIMTPFNAVILKIKTQWDWNSPKLRTCRVKDLNTELLLRDWSDRINVLSTCFLLNGSSFKLVIRLSPREW